jgi:BlaI family penicillinase repressor
MFVNGKISNEYIVLSKDFFVLITHYSNLKIYSMKKLTRKEEEVMKILWKLEKAFVKDIVEEYDEPKPHYNTVSSLVRLLQDKGIIGFTQYGNTYEYFPLMTKEEYRKTFMKQVVSDYFDNSYKSAVAFFVKEKGLSPAELEELIKLIKEQE